MDATLAAWLPCAPPSLRGGVRHEFIAQGRPLPKRDIVDTCFHASRAAGPCTATRTALPTVWEKTQLDNRRRSYSLSIAHHRHNQIDSLDKHSRSYSRSILIPSISNRPTNSPSIARYHYNCIDSFYQWAPSSIEPTLSSKQIRCFLEHFPLIQVPPPLHSPPIQQSLVGSAPLPYIHTFCLLTVFRPQYPSLPHHLYPLTINLSIIFPTMNDNQNNGPSQDPP
ncbi:hypothetical protein OH76DRAFT_1420455 [Lentinus brumalis]|uniref:Uncharacterized protein n=1 Tax=Lentinus brumalis TaxID=2498619 RepID=A0A371CJU9_9APHY|nr:hypothetical protein OH76DRAFT_1423638 [Polyporus brumalis]RDX45879.1 hypothetical protein OH76DRAFT_1420455 [Polyporus brumalis]